MLVMTAKVDKKKIAIILAAAIVLIAGLFLLLRNPGEAEPTAAPSLSTNDGRVKFLTDFGWEVASSPVESSQVRIPNDTSEVYERYNALQKSQGFDLTQYAGKTVMRYVYKVNNYPNATEPVYATLLIYKNKVIGGDVTDTAAKGVVRGFQMPGAAQKPTDTGAPSVGTTPQTAPSAPSDTQASTTPENRS